MFVRDTVRCRVPTQRLGDIFYYGQFNGRNVNDFSGDIMSLRIGSLSPCGFKKFLAFYSMAGITRPYSREKLYTTVA